jgi:hypothetical protein
VSMQTPTKTLPASVASAQPTSRRGARLRAAG